MAALAVAVLNAACGSGDAQGNTATAMPRVVNSAVGVAIAGASITVIGSRFGDKLRAAPFVSETFETGGVPE